MMLLLGIALMILGTVLVIVSFDSYSFWKMLLSGVVGIILLSLSMMTFSFMVATSIGLI